MRFAVQSKGGNPAIKEEISTNRETGWEELSPESPRMGCQADTVGSAYCLRISWTGGPRSNPPKTPCSMASHLPPSCSSTSKDINTRAAGPRKGRSHHHTSETAGHAAPISGGRRKVW